jgi:hypothetical protein
MSGGTPDSGSGGVPAGPYLKRGTSSSSPPLGFPPRSGIAEAARYDPPFPRTVAAATRRAAVVAASDLDGGLRRRGSSDLMMADGGGEEGNASMLKGSARRRRAWMQTTSSHSCTAWILLRSSSTGWRMK